MCLRFVGRCCCFLDAFVGTGLLFSIHSKKLGNIPGPSKLFLVPCPGHDRPEDRSKSGSMVPLVPHATWYPSVIPSDSQCRMQFRHLPCTANSWCTILVVHVDSFACCSGRLSRTDFVVGTSPTSAPHSSVGSN